MGRKILDLAHACCLGVMVAINNPGTVEQYAIFLKHAFVDLFRLDEVFDFSSSPIIEVMEGPLDVPVSDPEAVQEPTVFLGAWAFSLAMGSRSQGEESLILLLVAAMGCPLYGEWSILNINRCDRVQYHGVLGLA